MENTAEQSVAESGASDFPMHLEEFCTRLSKTERRVELLGAFHKIELAAGRVMDTESVFAGRFAAFVNQPA